MQETNDLDPRRILLNATGFRSKFHIYEIAQTCDRDANHTIYVVRKQILNHAPLGVMQEIRASEKHSELQVEREDVATIYDMIRAMSLPASRTGHAGKDGAWYGLQIGMHHCSTTIRWWSDREPELQPVYKLRDNIVKTVKQLIRSAKIANTTQQ